MNILLLNGNADPGKSSFDGYVKDLTARLEEGGSEADCFDIRSLTIRYCTGCWSCWWKTPGVCSIKDDMVALYPKIVRADALILASPVSAGFVSSLVKKVTDRLIPMLLPYIEIVSGECHHSLRYDRMPRLGLLLGKEQDTDDNDLAVIREIYERTALNMRSDLSVFESTDRSFGEVANVISGN